MLARPNDQRSREQWYVAYMKVVNVLITVKNDWKLLEYSIREGWGKLWPRP